MSAGPTPEDREKRRRRLAEIFGDVLPDQTADDLPEPATGSFAAENAGEEWLLQQVPPHHG